VCLGLLSCEALNVTVLSGSTVILCVCVCLGLLSCEALNVTVLSGSTVILCVCVSRVVGL